MVGLGSRVWSAGFISKVYPDRLLGGGGGGGEPSMTHSYPSLNSYINMLAKFSPCLYVLNTHHNFNYMYMQNYFITGPGVFLYIWV